MQFSSSSDSAGIAEQARILMHVDSTQWPNTRIANSCNNHSDRLTGYFIATDKRFQWDNTNHSALPEGTVPSVTTTADYSFLTDQDGNTILTLIGISRLDSASGLYIPLKCVDRNDPDVDLSTFGTTTGTPTSYDKIADNIVRFDKKVGTVISAYFKFYFQRTPSRFASTDTTKTSGFAPLLDRGYVIAAAYDGALTLGLPNLNSLAMEMQREEQKMKEYFAGRNRDLEPRMVPRVESCK